MRPPPPFLLALLLLCPHALATERAVEFEGANRVRLSGTLVLPSAASPDHPAPAVLLIPGSGPTDRNGNQPPLLWSGLLKQLADALSDAGIASLRFDKRGVGGSGRPPRDFAELCEYTAWEHFVGDAVGACAALRGQPEVERSRVALAGHSEGGLVVMHAAVALQEKDDPPAAVVLLATPGRRVDVLLRAQLKAICQRLNVSEAGAARLIERNDAIAAEVREHGRVPADIPPDLVPLYPRYIARFYQGQLKTSPTEMASSLTMPVLVMQGDKDLQVSAEDDAPLLIAGASHNLKKVENEGEHAIFGPVVPEVRSKLSGWLKEVLEKPR
jgi:pimeloyl-ACP methyl ester carboxylesterase